MTKIDMVMEEKALEMFGYNLSIEAIDIFERFLEEKGIVVNNPEKDKYGEKDCANIFGSDYFHLETDLQRVFNQYVTRLLIDHDDKLRSCILDIFNSIADDKWKKLTNAVKDN